MKKIKYLLLIAIFTCCLCGCGKTIAKVADDDISTTIDKITENGILVDYDCNVDKDMRELECCFECEERGIQFFENAQGIYCVYFYDYENSDNDVYMDLISIKHEGNKFIMTGIDEQMEEHTFEVSHEVYKPLIYNGEEYMPMYME